MFRQRLAEAGNPQIEEIPEFSRYYITPDGMIFNRHGRRLRDHNCNGYRRISLIKDDGNRVGVDIHRLVAVTYIENPIPDGMWVNHEDGDKANNHVDNLRIDTPSYNHQHAHRHLNRATAGTYSLSSQAMVVLRDAGWTQYEIAEALGCSQSNVSTVLSRRS